MRQFNGFKKCSGCGDVLPVCMFSKDRYKPDGLQCECKDCDSERRKKWHEAHKAKANERCRKYYEENREKRLEQAKEYQKDHPEVARRKSARCKGYQDAVELFENPYPNWIPVDYHHIDDHHTIPIPRVIHTRYTGKYYPRKKHQELLKPIIQDLYQISYDHLEVTK